MTALPPFDPDDPVLVTDPYPLLRRYREEEPVHWGLARVPGIEREWWLFRHEDVSLVLADPRFGRPRSQVAGRVARPNHPRMFSSLASQWLGLRRMP